MKASLAVINNKLVESVAFATEVGAAHHICQTNAYVCVCERTGKTVDSFVEVFTHFFGGPLATVSYIPLASNVLRQFGKADFYAISSYARYAF